MPLAPMSSPQTAYEIFTKAQEDYRARKIGDAEFLAARTAYLAEHAAWEAEFRKHDNNG